MTKLELAQELLKQWTQEKEEKPKRLVILLAVGDLLAAVKKLKDWGYFAALIGLDEGENLVALYIFCAGDEILSLKVQLAREKPILPSLYEILPAAALQERELQELFGIRVEGMPDDAHLLLPDDWPAGVYPLRKDAVLE